MPEACLSSNLTEFLIGCSGWLVKLYNKAPLDLAVPLYGYVAPPIILVTLITNVFVVVVLCQKQLRTPTNVILLAMAVTEVLTGLSSLPWFLYYYTFSGFETDRDDGLPMFWCKTYSVFTEHLPSMCYNASIFLTVYLAVQRYIYVCRSQLAVGCCTIRRSRLVVIALCSVAVLFEIPKCTSSMNMPRVFSAEDVAAVHQLGYFDNDTDVPLRTHYCVFRFADWVELVGPNEFFNFYYWSNAVCIHTIPCLALAVLTFILLSRIRKADERRKASFLKPLMNSIDKDPKMLSHRKRDRRGSAFTSLPERMSLATRNGEKRMSNYLSVPDGRNGNPLQLSAVSFTKKRYYQSTTKMLVVVIGIVLVIEVPAACVFILHTFLHSSHDDGTVSRNLYVALNKLLLVRNIAILLSYPFNFVIYCGMSHQFRQTVKALICRGSANRRDSTRHWRLPPCSYAPGDGDLSTVANNGTAAAAAAANASLNVRELIKDRRSSAVDVTQLLAASKHRQLRHLIHKSRSGSFQKRPLDLNSWCDDTKVLQTST